ncbi:MAG: DNA-3-methyladenine glycosylase 2 family protein [Nitrospirae bacterium]|nr:DNA-3-methyladenine glycosylase 2 family protein [Nitrospirota bacterium]
MKTLNFSLKPLAPFRLDLTAWVLRRRHDNRIDRWDGERYARILPYKNRPLSVTVSQGAAIARPLIHVSVSGKGNAPESEIRTYVTSFIEKALGIRLDLTGFYAMAAQDKYLRPLAERFRGVKPPCFPTLFEALVNAFACQQLTLTLGIILLNRLTRQYGLPFIEGNETSYAFPRPEDLCRAKPEEIRSLGYSTQKGRAIVELSRQLVDEGLNLNDLETMEDGRAHEYLMRLRGVGRWSAEYVMLRGLGRIRYFPGDDVGAQRNIRELLGLREKPDYGRIKKITGRWDPYPGFVYFHLLLADLERRGFL